MKVLVTGATGFVGGAVARALVRAGVDVRVLARAGSDLHNLEGLAVEQVAGDLRDPASLRNALTGCRQLYHVAAHYALWAKDPSIYYDINVAGTRNLLETAGAAGLERTVYCSTIGAIGIPPGGGLGGGALRGAGSRRRARCRSRARCAASGRRLPGRGACRRCLR